MSGPQMEVATAIDAFKAAVLADKQDPCGTTYRDMIQTGITVARLLQIEWATYPDTDDLARLVQCWQEQHTPMEAITVAELEAKEEN